MFCEEEVSKLLPDEIEKIIQFLEKILGNVVVEKSTISKLIYREQEEHRCAFCHSTNIVKNGYSKNKIQRYKCKDCLRRFNDKTLTPTAHSKLPYKTWLSFFECMNEKLSIRKTATKLNLNKNTVFAMRHKVLNALSTFRNEVKLSKNIQVDELYESINLKGLPKNQMPRFSKPRKSQGGSKRGISNHQICIASAIDELDNIFLQIVGTGPITTEMIEKVFENKIKPESLIIADCKSSYEQYAKKHKLKLEQVKSGTYQNLNGYNLSEINALHSNFRNFMQSFLGVSTKHLQEYLDWFAYQKYLNYTVELLSQPLVMLKTIITQTNNITVSEIYNKDFPIDIYEVYAEYNYHPSPQI